MATSARFQLKRDTTANWLASTVKLQSGEPGWDYEAKILKIGNGNDLWPVLVGVSGAGGSSLTPLTLAFPTTTNVFDNDNTINIASSWISGTPPITNGKLVIQEISASVPLYTLSPITFPSSVNDYQIILPNGTYFNYGSSYKVIAQTSTGAQIAETAYITYQPNVSFSLGTPYIVSAKSIGVPYTYATNGPRIVGMKFKVYTTDQNAPIQPPTTVTIPRNYSGNTITTQQFVTYPSSYVEGTNYTIAAYYDGVGGSVPISSTTSELSYTTPTISSYTFSPNSNRSITVRMNNSANVTLSATYTTSSGSITDKSAELINAQSSGDIYLSSYPEYNTSYTIRATFADNTASIPSFITATSPLIFNKRGNISRIDFPQSATTNPGTFIPSLTFTNIFDNVGNASARLLITNTTNSSDTGTLIISNALNSGGNTPFSASGSGADTVYAYNGALSYNFTYGQTYRFDLLNSDAAKYVFSTITIGPLIGTFQAGSAITEKKAGVSGLSLTVAGLSWTGIGFTSLLANIYTSTDTSFTSSLGSGTYNTNNGSISINLSGSNTFQSGIMYVISVTMPNGTILKSQNSDPYVVTYIIRQPNTVLFSDRVPARFTWVESSAELAIWSYNIVTGTRITEINRQTRSIGSDALNSDNNTDITLGGASFTYNTYYQLEVKYTTTSQTSFYSLPFQYVYDSFSVTSGPTFPTSNSLSTNIVSSGISGETRLFLSVYEITDATIQTSGIAIDTPSVSTSLTNTYFDGAALTFSGGVLQPVSLSATFNRRNYYFVVIKFGADDTGFELARSSTANLYNPSGILVTSVVNTGAFIGPSSIPVSLTIDGVTTGSSYYLQLRNSSNTALNTADGFSRSTVNALSEYPTSVAGTLPTTITYTFPIEKLSNNPKTYSYYLFGALKPPSPATSITSRYPSTDATYFNYTYDSSIYTTVGNRPSVSFDNEGKATFTMKWKGFPTRAWPYLTNSGGTAILRRFQPIDLIYSGTETTVTTTALSAYSGTYSSASLLLPERSVVPYYPAFSLNGPPTTGAASADTSLFPFLTEKITTLASINFTPPFWEITSLNGVTSNTVTFALSFTGGYPSGSYPASNTFNVTIPNAGVSGNLFSGTITSGDNGTKTFTLTGGQTFAQSNAVSQTTYTFSIEQKLGLTAATFSFKYYPTLLTSPTLVFENNSTNSLYGNLNSSGTVQTSDNATLTLRLDLMKYDTSVAIAGVLISSQTFDFTQGQITFTKLWTQDLFDLGSYYNVNYTITNSIGAIKAGGLSSDRLLSANLLYNPVGYDILVFIGQSNMAGRDNGTYYINALTTASTHTPTEAVYPRKYESTQPPQYTNAELTTAITDKNGNPVQLVTVDAYNSSVARAPIPATAAAFASGQDSAAVNCVSPAYDFTKLYANSSFLRSNRQVATVFVPRGGSGFVNVGEWYSRRQVGNPPTTTPGPLYNGALAATNSFMNINLSGTYSANRVVAIVMHQGEADIGRTTWVTRVDETISDFIQATPKLSSTRYTQFLCGNLEFLTVAAGIDLSNNTGTNPDVSGADAIITAAEQTVIRNGFHVPNQIDSFITYKSGEYRSDSFSSLGLTSMDIDPLQYTYPTVGSTFSFSTPGQAIHFSSRSERLLGLRAYNAYARLNGKVASSTEPSLATDSTICIPPKTSTYNTQTNILTFESTANNCSFSANPIAYLLSYTSAYITPSINWVVTEYCTYRSTIPSVANPTTVVTTNILSCAIPYNKYSSGSNILCSYPAGTQTDIVIGGNTITGNIYGARYSFPTSGEAYTLNYNSNFAASSVTPKPLSLDMNDLIDAISTQLNEPSKVTNYSISTVSITIKAIYSDVGLNPSQLSSEEKRGMLLSNISYQLPPIVGNKLLRLRDVGASYLIPFGSGSNIATIPTSTHVTNWIITPTAGGGGGVPLLNTNIATGGSGSSYLVIAGCPGTATTSAPWQGPTPQTGGTTSYAISTTSGSASIIDTNSSIVTVTIISAAPVGVNVGDTANVGLSTATTFSDGGATGIFANVLGYSATIVGIANTRQTLSLLFPDRPNLSITLTSSGPGKVAFAGGQEINIVSSSNLSILQGTSTLRLTLTSTANIPVNTPVKITFANTGTLPAYSGKTNNRLQSTLNGIYYTVAGTATNLVYVTVPGQIAGTFTPGSSATVEINSNVPGLKSTINSFSTGSAPYVTQDIYSIVGYPTSTLSTNFTPNAFGPLTATTWSHTGAANTGFTYCRIVNGIDWALFFSASKYATTAMSAYTGRTTNPSCSVNSYQFCGIAPEIVSTTYSILRPAGVTLESTLSTTGNLRPFFYYMYNTGCGFIINLRNVNALKTYTVSYYISTRSGRVPHNNTLLTPTANINGVTTDIYLTNPLPIRVFTQIPTNITSLTTPGINDATAQIGQDVHFGTGSQTGPVISTVSTPQTYLTTSYLHPSSGSPWDGSWKQMSFKFNLSSLTITGVSADGIYSYNHAYIRFGPLPMTRGGGTPEFIDTSINIAGISVNIVN